MIWDTVVAYLSHLGDEWAIDLASRGVGDWLLFFAPVILLEVPQYYVPMVGLAVARVLGLPRVDHHRQANFLRKAPMVSIVVAGRNEAGTIEACIRSLLDQSYPNFEIIIVDDHSELKSIAVSNESIAVSNGLASGFTHRPSSRKSCLSCATVPSFSLLVFEPQNRRIEPAPEHCALPHAGVLELAAWQRDVQVAKGHDIVAR